MNDRTFENLLNAFEDASNKHQPAQHNYRDKRKAVIEHEAVLRARVDELEEEKKENDASFELYRSAVARGTKNWHRWHPEEANTLPDLAAMIDEMCARIEQLESKKVKWSTEFPTLYGWYIIDTYDGLIEVCTDLQEIREAISWCDKNKILWRIAGPMHIDNSNLIGEINNGN